MHGNRYEVKFRLDRSKTSERNKCGYLRGSVPKWWLRWGVVTVKVLTVCELRRKRSSSSVFLRIRSLVVWHFSARTEGVSRRTEAHELSGNLLVTIQCFFFFLLELSCRLQASFLFVGRTRNAWYNATNQNKYANSQKKKEEK